MGENKWRGRGAYIKKSENTSDVIDRIGYTDAEAKRIQEIVEQIMNGDINIINGIINDHNGPNLTSEIHLDTQTSYTEYDKFLRILVDNGSIEQIETIIRLLVHEDKLDFKKDGDSSLKYDLGKRKLGFVIKVFEDTGDITYLNELIEYWEKDNSQKKNQIKKLQEMLKKTLKFVEQIKQSTIGKIFFKKQLVNLELGNGQLGEGRTEENEI